MRPGFMAAMAAPRGGKASRWRLFYPYRKFRAMQFGIHEASASAATAAAAAGEDDGAHKTLGQIAPRKAEVGGNAGVSCQKITLRLTLPACSRTLLREGPGCWCADRIGAAAERRRRAARFGYDVRHPSRTAPNDRAERPPLISAIPPCAARRTSSTGGPLVHRGPALPPKFVGRWNATSKSTGPRARTRSHTRLLRATAGAAHAGLFDAAEITDRYRNGVAAPRAGTRGRTDRGVCSREARFPSRKTSIII